MPMPSIDRCQHVLVEETRTGTLVCCFRLLPLSNGAEIGASYSAQYYNLAALADFDGPMVEMGRFCIHPDWRDPDILRVAWGAMTRFVDETGVEMLFGCSSFHGTEAEAYHDAFAMLKDRHLAPKRWLPRVKAPNVFRFARALRRFRPDAKRAMQAMPPAAAHLPADGRLGQRPCGGGPRPEHAACLYRAGDPGDPARRGHGFCAVLRAKRDVDLSRPAPLAARHGTRTPSSAFRHLADLWRRSGVR